MTNRHDQINAYNITTEKRRYIVILERLKNTYSGNPRYKAIIIYPDTEHVYCYNAVYTFQGHYFGDIGEAEYIVNFHENNN